MWHRVGRRNRSRDRSRGEVETAAPGGGARALAPSGAVGVNRSLRSERGQTASEYMGILLLVAVIVGALIASDVDGRIARAASDAVALVAGGNGNGGSGPTGSGGHPAGPGSGPTQPGGPGSGPGGGPGSAPGANPSGGPGGGPGGSGGNRSGGPSGNPSGGPGSGPGGNPSGGSGQTPEQEEKRIALCLGSAAEAGNCLLAARAPNAVSEKITERARDRVRLAQRNLYNSSARPGTPEYNDLVAKRAQAIRDLVNSRRITDNFIVKPLAQVRKAVDPRYRDFEKGFDRASKALRGPKTDAPVALRPNTSSAGPIKPGPASRVLKGLGKVGKGLGIAGTALSLYDNVRNDGVAKGITKTAGGVAGAWGAGAAVTAGCAAIGVATAGIGGLACAGVAFGASYLGGKYGSKVAGWAYDRGADAVNFVDDHAVKPIANATKAAAHQVVEVGDKLADGGKKVIGALNPFG
jgi:hypothetical protein